MRLIMGLNFGKPEGYNTIWSQARPPFRDRRISLPPLYSEGFYLALV